MSGYFAIRNQSRLFFCVFLGVFLFKPYLLTAQYCITNNFPSTFGYINDVFVPATKLANLNSYTTEVPGRGFYQNVSQGLPINIDLMQGASYTFSIMSTNDHNKISLWIDYDRDSLFEASEWQQITASSPINQFCQAVITVPQNATPGPTGLRVRSRYVNNQNGAGDACLNMGSGETEDFMVNIIPTVINPTLPNSINILAASNDTVCRDTTFYVFVNENINAFGVTYQWESSTDSLSWNVLVNNSTDAFYKSTITSTTYFRCLVSLSGNSIYSSVVKVYKRPCFCKIQSNGGNPGYAIGNFSLNGASFGTYSQIINAPMPGSNYLDNTYLPALKLTTGATYGISVAGITSDPSFDTCLVEAYIDFNRDDILDPLTEYFWLGYATPFSGGNVVNTTISIPLSATGGITGMRVSLKLDFFMAPQTPCVPQTNWYGEVEDYTVYIDTLFTSTSNLTQNAQLSIYPNPTRNSITVYTGDGKLKNAQFKLFNLQGQVVLEGGMEGKMSKVLNVSSFPKGIYFIALQSDTELATHKIVIE